MRQLIALAYVVRGFYLFREGERYSQKKVAVEQSAATLFYASGGIANYRALTFRKQKSFGTFADKTEEECA